MKHTVGPWKWNEIGYCWLEGADDSTIIHASDDCCIVPFRNDPNAILIASAPELLRVCKKALDWILNTGDGSGHPSIAQELETIISKAETPT